MKTKRGIYLNLKESEYTFSIDGLTFFFSSKLYCEKFKNNLMNYIQNETYKLSQRYNVKINFDLFFMISLYKKIEKRGFYIIENSTKMELKDKIITNTII